MATILSLISVCSFIMALIGLFSPKTSLFWYKGERTRLRSSLIYFLAFFIFGGIGGAMSPKSTTAQQAVEEPKKSNIEESPKVEERPKIEIVQHSATFENVTGTHKIHCRTRNNTNKLVTYLDIKATFYDKSGKIVGTGLGNAANLAGQSEKTIDVLAIGVENADKYEVQVDNVIYQ